MTRMGIHKDVWSEGIPMYNSLTLRHMGELIKFIKEFKVTVHAGTPELSSSQGHFKSTVTYGTISSEKNTQKNQELAE